MTYWSVSNIAWQPATNQPDADQIVLVYVPDASEPVWLGYYDDEQIQWFYDDGSVCQPTHWMELPEGPQS